LVDDVIWLRFTGGPLDGRRHTRRHPRGLAPGQIWVDMSTVSPRANRDLSEHVRAQGATMLDAPVSGSVPSPDGWPPAPATNASLGGVMPVESA